MFFENIEFKIAKEPKQKSPNMPNEQIPPQPKKEYTKEELFDIALKYIESIVNRGSSDIKARTKNLVAEELQGHKESYIEEATKKAWEMVESGEAEKIARTDYKGGLEKIKTQEEKEKEMEEDEED